ncbi:MAG: chitobiase/beta-hexosaminidase C-terminal domain-containing protein, partial [Planctomycetaceae bacterium]
AMRRLNAAGELTGPESLYFRETKPVEELYDTQRDPHEIDNLADDPQYADVLARMRTALEDWQVRIGDLGLVPEPLLMERMLPEGKPPVTEPVVITPPETKGESVTVVLTCPTPGASIAWTTEEGRDAHWHLYSGPVTLPRGTVVRTKACRLGYRDSRETRVEL